MGREGMCRWASCSRRGWAVLPVMPLLVAVKVYHFTQLFLRGVIALNAVGHM